MVSSHRRETAAGKLASRVTGGARRLPRSSARRRRRILAPAALALVLVGGGSVAAIGTLADDGGTAPAPQEQLADATLAPTDDVAPATTGPTTGPTDPAAPTGKDKSKRTKPVKTAKPGEKKNLLRELAEELAEKTPGVAPAVFRPATLNLLGDSHTRKGGNKARMGTGAARMAGAVNMLRSQDVDVVALQEFEQVQKGAFARITGAAWSVFTGSERGRDSVAYRNDVWSFVSGGTRQMPYFRGQQIPMPYVLLEHRETGRQVYFISMHNPVSNARRGNNQHWRNVATSIQINLVRELSADGTPVLLMGDFNERQEAFCKVAGSGMLAANGGVGSPCQPPPGAGIDWIFGTGNLTFSDYARIDGGAMNRITDHPLIVSTVTYDAPLDIEPLPPQNFKTGN